MEADEELRAAAGGRGPQNHTAPPLPRKAFAHASAQTALAIIGAEVWQEYFTFSVERNPWDTVVSLYFWHYRDAEPVPFEEFLATERIETLAAKNALTYRLDGAVAVDRVLRQESLDADLAEVWAELSLPGTPLLPRAKAGSRPRRAHYREMFTPVTAARVADVFAEAIEEFGYTF